MTPATMDGPTSRLPGWDGVLAVVAHPDDESFGLGAVLAAFVDAGARVAVLCLTHGELSTVHGVEGDLSASAPRSSRRPRPHSASRLPRCCTTRMERSHRHAAPSSPARSSTPPATPGPTVC